MENDLNSMNSMRKRNLDTVYPNRVSATPDSFTKRPCTVAATHVKHEIKTPSINLDDKIEKAAMESSTKKIQ